MFCWIDHTQIESEARATKITEELNGDIERIENCINTMAPDMNAPDRYRWSSSLHINSKCPSNLLILIGNDKEVKEVSEGFVLMSLIR